MTVRFEVRPIEEVKVGDKIRRVGIVREVVDTGRSLAISVDGLTYPALKNAGITMEVVLDA